MTKTSCLVALMMIFMSPDLLADNYCGELDNGSNGPFDYTDFNLHGRLRTVETHHFTKNVENLRQGNTGSIAGDINYTLRAFPNHHRALAALTKLVIREKTPKPQGATYTIGCYFERAIRFRPNDEIVRSLYANYLIKSKKNDQAIEQLKIATKLRPDSAVAHYNLGLLYLKKKNYENARLHAKKAYSLDFPLPGLKDKLINAGQWNE